MILRAEQIQPRDDSARVIAEQSEGAVARMIAQGIDALDRTISLPALTALIAENRFNQMWRHLALERLGAAIRPALDRLTLIRERSALRTGAAIDLAKTRRPRLITPAVIPLPYDPSDPVLAQQQRAEDQRIVDQLEESANAQAQAVISEGLTRGDPPARIARHLRETLAMSAPERAAIENYRAMLNNAPARALGAALRDRRFDASARRGDLDEAQIEAMVARYAQRYRSFRALRLARTEALRAANQGRAAAWAQYARLTGREYRRFWLTAGDELVCPICRVIPGLNPDGIGPDDDYETPIGPIHAPPDPHPNCRCSERFMQI